MKHNHNEQFCLTCVLGAVTPLLPHQGPIKDFIHQNTLQVFIDTPFHDALRVGADVYGAQAYMGLNFYRAKYRAGEIAQSSIDEAITECCGTIGDDERALFHDALLNFIEITDETTLNFLLKQRKINEPDQATVRERIARICRRNETVSLRSVLNDRVGCAIDHDVNALLFRLLGSYLDQGVILWPLLEECNSFRSAVLTLADDSDLPLAHFVDNEDLAAFLDEGAESGVGRALSYMFESALRADYVKESLLHHPGWSGMVNVVAHSKDALAKPRDITMQDFLLVKLALEWQFIKHQCPDFCPISLDDVKTAQKNLSSCVDHHALSLTHWLLTSAPDVANAPDAVIKKITVDALQQIWHLALERHFYASVEDQFTVDDVCNDGDCPKQYQAVFCIDDRECSFRRHLEAESSAIETFGFPGFFGIEFYFKSHKKDLLEKLCPAPVTPQYVVTECVENNTQARRKNSLLEFASFISRHGANSMFFGFVSAYTIGHLSAFRLLFSFFQPSLLRSSNRRSGEKTTLVFHRSEENPTENGLLLGFTHDEMAERIYTALTNMGLTKNFAPLVFIIGHGSSSVNNPHFAAYDCGACSGRPGSINARLFAAMANTKQVRAGVNERGIIIPDDTIFVGGLHDTCTDEITLFDVDILTPDQQARVKKFSEYVHRAQGKNAQERCRRFALVKSNIGPDAAMKEARHRSRALFEPRPELGHATNALCVVGRRARTYGKNFDRRAFLQSYDPTNDDNGTVLAAIMSAVVPVCGGINLEYFFSRVDPAVYGCGTKLSHNVCSLIGVGNGLDDDLRTGLPIQMTEIHDPVRLLIIIEQRPQIIEKAVMGNPQLLPWVANDWLKIASLNPTRNELSFYDANTKSFLAPGSWRQAC